MSALLPGIEVAGNLLLSGGTAWIVSHRQLRRARRTTTPAPRPSFTANDLADAVADWAARHDVPEAAPMLMQKVRLRRQLQRRRYDQW